MDSKLERQQVNVKILEYPCLLKVIDTTDRTVFLYWAPYKGIDIHTNQSVWSVGDDAPDINKHPDDLEFMPGQLVLSNNYLLKRLRP